MRTSNYHDPITPDNAVVLFIDYQTQLMLGCQSMEPQELKNNTLALARIAKIYDLPIVITTTGGGASGPAGPTFSELTAEFPGHEIIDRQLYYNSMQDPTFRAAVERTGRKKLIIGGITTDLCVVFPAITAVADGYDVYVVGDACASWTRRIDDLAIARVRQAGAIVTNVQSLAAELQTNLAAQNPSAAQRHQTASFAFYGRFVGPLSLLNDVFMQSPENRKRFGLDDAAPTGTGQVVAAR
ncbi:MAG TPA: isochorismatase family protein [Gemmatimonas sp.]|nr:isochorismatase family protein [Gemmatimonas sp.]